jgi:hypothetical protein
LPFNVLHGQATGTRATAGKKTAAGKPAVAGKRKGSRAFYREQWVSGICSQQCMIFPFVGVRSLWQACGCGATCALEVAYGYIDICVNLILQ